MNKRLKGLLPKAPMTDEEKQAEREEFERQGVKKPAFYPGATAQALEENELGRLRKEVVNLKAALEQSGQGGERFHDVEGRLKQAEAELEATTQELTRRVLSGMISVDINPEQLVDEVSSDRVNIWDKGKEFEKLKENIQFRGQTQPIRVRPLDGWKPSKRTPEVIEPTARFAVQSGRRRWMACKALGIPVRVVIANGAASALADEDRPLSIRAADLEERYAENTMRQDLTFLERLLSIGEICEQLTKEGVNLNQRDLASRLSVTQENISLAKTCYENREALIAELGTNPSKEQIRNWRKEVQAPKGRAAMLEFELPGAGKVVISQKGKNMTVTVPGVHIPEDAQSGFQAKLTELLSEYISTATKA